MPIRPCQHCHTKNRIPLTKTDQNPQCGKCSKDVGYLNTPLNIESTEDFDLLIQSSKTPILVDFWAAWCGPCKMVAPELQKLAHQKTAKVIIAKVDTEKLPNLSQKFSIRGIPSLLLFKNGKLVQEQSGAMSAEQIAQTFNL